MYVNVVYGILIWCMKKPVFCHVEIEEGHFTLIPRITTFLLHSIFHPFGSLKTCLCQFFRVINQENMGKMRLETPLGLSAYK